MARLQKDSTVNDEKIIHEGIKSDHTHYAMDVTDFTILSTKDMGEGGGIYAEQIHGNTLEDLENRYLNEDNNVFQGSLEIINSTDKKSLINKGQLDQYADDNVLKKTLNSIPDDLLFTIGNSNNSIVVKNSHGEVDSTRFILDNNEQIFKPSITGPKELNVNNTYNYFITNHSNLFNYIVRINEPDSTISKFDDRIEITTPSSNANDKNITFEIELENNVYEFEILLKQG